LAFGTAGDAHFLEPHWLELRRYRLESGAAPGQRAVQLLHLADLHASRVVSLDYIGEAIEFGLQTKPDVICVTGDFITHKYDQFDPYRRILSRLSSAAPTFACLGNHDGGQWSAKYWGFKSTAPVSALLRRSGIELLFNRCASLRIGGRNIQIIGLGDWWAGGLDPARAFEEARGGPGSPGSGRVETEKPFRIVLSHNPDTKVFLAQYEWDLLLSGHTHGGQFYMPLIGAPFAPVKDKRFIDGMYQWNNRRIHITKGVGNVWGLRLNCRPDVSLITIG
jgi:hypothetical protein